MSCAVLAQFCPEDVSWFLHEWVAVSAASKDAGFEAAGAVGDFAGGDLFQQSQAMICRKLPLRESALSGMSALMKKPSLAISRQ